MKNRFAELNEEVFSIKADRERSSLIINIYSCLVASLSDRGEVIPDIVGELFVEWLDKAEGNLGDDLAMFRTLVNTLLDYSARIGRNEPYSVDEVAEMYGIDSQTVSAWVCRFDVPESHKNHTFALSVESVVKIGIVSLLMGFSGMRFEYAMTRLPSYNY